MHHYLSNQTLAEKVCFSGQDFTKAPSRSTSSTHHKSLVQRCGQGMVEYIIVVALVAVAAIGVYQLFGQVVRSQTAAMAKELAGEDGTSDSQTAQSAAQKASAQTAAKSLKSFTGNASAGE